jgi:hypothetical protein
LDVQTDGHDGTRSRIKNGSETWTQEQRKKCDENENFKTLSWMDIYEQTIKRGEVILKYVRNFIRMDHREVAWEVVDWVQLS